MGTHGENSIMNGISKEPAMEMLAAMVIMDRAAESGGNTDEVLRKFRRSDTFQNLFDESTGLWMNGPDYISDEYDRECERLNHTR